MLCSEQLIAKPCPFFNSIRLEHKTNTCFPFFLAAYENSEHVISMKNDDLPLSNMANTEMNACYKILCAGYCSLVVTQENVFPRCKITSLCTDVPPPSEKIGRRDSSPDFFFKEGGRLYTGYTITKGYFSISHNLPNFFLTVQNKCINFSLPERHVQGDQPERKYSALTSAPKCTFSVHCY